MIKHFLAAALIVSASAVAVAQQPTEETRPSQSQGQPDQQQQPSNQFNTRDYTQIQSSEVPANLRKTLQGDTYHGWESGKIYRNNNGDGYYLTTGTGTSTQSYYFDRNGKAINNNGTQKSNSDKSSNPGSSSGSGAGGAGKPAGGAEKP
jgi:uncharacterized protein YdeI (BOF family)